MLKRKKRRFSTTRTILLSFLVVILTGSLLLSLPISSADGKWVSYIDALFTSTTATCVTGLTVNTTATSWSLFGQAVILVLIQIGGLGVITVLSIFMIMLHRKIGLKDKIIIRDSFNLNSMGGLVAFVKKVVKGAFIIEGAGAILYMLVFVPRFGIKGIWISVFNSVSAFCNAGMDVIGPVSLCEYVHNPLINFTTTTLIILGGIGFIVWWDVMRIVKERKGFGGLTLHSKIAITTTAFLIISGTIVVLIGEYNNPLTMKEFNLPEKLMASFFQSVTTRTAGFATIAQENLSNLSAIYSIILMFIGGSPVGTAGGIKTATLAVLVAAAVSSVRNRNDVVMFNRRLSFNALKKAVGVLGVSFTTLFISTCLLSLVTDANGLDIVYEITSATATVGLSRSLTSALNSLGKVIVIFTMYFGRVGPISLAIAFAKRRKNENVIKNPIEEISIG